MQPLLHEGDFVFSAPWLRKAKSGKLVVVGHPRYGTIIKRVSSVEADGSFWLSSDHSDGIKKWEMGCIAADQPLGRVVFSVKK